MLPRIPPPVRAVLSVLPHYPPSAALCFVLNAFASRLFAPDEIARLEGKVICVHVRDAALRLTLRVCSTGYTPCVTGTEPHVTITADARDYIQLALRNADPDTLFFDRRLMISGETEVGLIVKNALDRVEPPLPAPVLRFLRRQLQRSAPRR